MHGNLTLATERMAKNWASGCPGSQRKHYFKGGRAMDCARYLGRSIEVRWEESKGSLRPLDTGSSCTGWKGR